MLVSSSKKIKLEPRSKLPLFSNVFRFIQAVSYVAMKWKEIKGVFKKLDSSTDFQLWMSMICW
jgi:hypothetical protein